MKSSAAIILQALREISQLVILSLSYNLLMYLESSELVSIIRNNPSLTKLSLGQNMLKSGLIDIAMSCTRLTNLQAIELSHNSISPMEVLQLASIVTNITSLQALMFSGLVLSAKEMFLFQFYNANSYNQNLMLQINDFIEHEIFEGICLETWRLHFSSTIKFCYDINIYGIQKYFFSIIIINMQANIVKYIKQNLSITSSHVEQSKLKLSQLNATNMIVSLFSIIITLKVLDLEYNNINKEAAVKLATALKCNNVLEQLWLRGNVLGADGAAVILTSLQNITTLRVLDLSYNNISSRSANGITAVINSNHFLEQLWLDGNMLMTTGVVIIASALKNILT